MAGKQASKHPSAFRSEMPKMSGVANRNDANGKTVSLETYAGADIDPAREISQPA